MLCAIIVITCQGSRNTKNLCFNRCCTKSWPRNCILPTQVRGKNKLQALQPHPPSTCTWTSNNWWSSRLKAVSISLITTTPTSTTSTIPCRLPTTTVATISTLIETGAGSPFRLMTRVPRRNCMRAYILVMVFHPTTPTTGSSICITPKCIRPSTVITWFATADTVPSCITTKSQIKQQHRRK